MNEKLRNHPLNGIGLESLLGDLVREYGWEVLAEQVPIDCFRHYPSFKSSVKFLRKTEWARERLEDLYLYKFLQYPLPEAEQQTLPPRNRLIDGQRLSDEAAKIELGSPEFFASPAKKTGRVRGTAGTSRRAASRESTAENKTSDQAPTNGAPDPWAKWRK